MLNVMSDTVFGRYKKKMEPHKKLKKENGRWTCWYILGFHYESTTDTNHLLKTNTGGGAKRVKTEHGNLAQSTEVWKRASSAQR